MTRMSKLKSKNIKTLEREKSNTIVELEENNVSFLFLSLFGIWIIWDGMYFSYL